MALYNPPSSLVTTTANGLMYAADKVKLDAVMDYARVLPLDGMPIAAAAWSVSERLVSSYTGPLFSVCRASDNATSDIGFTTSGRCDEAALAAFCGASVGYVAILYDQSGNGRDLTQSAGSRPSVYSGTAAYKDGSNVTMILGAGTWMARGDGCGLIGYAAFTQIVQHNFSSVSGSRWLVDLGSDTDGYRFVFASSGTGWACGSAAYGTANVTSSSYLIVQRAYAATTTQLLWREAGATRTASGSATSVSLANSKYTLGDPSNPAGAISTSILLPYTLSTRQQAQLENWLESRRTGVGWTAQLSRLAAAAEPTRLYPLDYAVSGIPASAVQAAYSVSERLLSSWAGPLFTVRRASDSATKDIGTDAYGVCDTAALAAFCSGTTGYVTKVYDQSGNGRDVTQATAANQPTIYASGSVQMDGAGNIAMLFAGQQHLARADACGISGNPTFSAVSLYNKLNSTGVTWILGPETGGVGLIAAPTATGLVFLWSSQNTTYGTSMTGNAPTYCVVSASSALGMGSYTVRENGVVKPRTAGYTGAISVSNTSFTIGNQQAASSTPIGTLSTQLLFSTQLTTAQLTAIETWLEARRTGLPWQANAGSNVGRITTEGVIVPPLQLSYAATEYLDVSSRAVFTVGKLTGNTTLTIVNPLVGATGRIVTQQDSTGGRTTSWSVPGGWTLQWLTTGTASTSANAIVAYDYQCVSIAGTSYVLMELVA